MESRADSVEMEAPDTPSVAELLAWRARQSGERRAYVFLDHRGNEQEERSYSDLSRHAHAIAQAVLGTARPGDRAALMYDPGMAFIDAFFGCLYAGIIAVPMMPPRPNRERQATWSIVQDCRPAVILTTRALATVLPHRLAEAGVQPVPTCLATDEVAPASASLAPSDPHWRANSHDVAFLQYTSGSTSAPKGVMVTHGNLRANARMIAAAMQQDDSSTFVGWTPLYHDQGLIGNVLQPLHLGCCAVLMAPNAFLQRPHLWIEAIARYRAHTSGGPDYAFGLIGERIDARMYRHLDLTCWKVAFNGAEPIRPATLDRFARALTPLGFSTDALYPCYGLAEATLFVSGATAGSGSTTQGFERAALGHGYLRPSKGGTRLVSSGKPAPQVNVVVVHPDSHTVLPDGRVGEIWIDAPSVAKGYWGKPDATASTFAAVTREGAGPFLRTGDLGALVDGELYVCGRLKDLIIVRGRNLYPQDLELSAVAAHPAISQGGAIAVEITAGGNETKLLIAVEINRTARHDVDADEVAMAVRRAIRDEHDVMAERVILLRPGGIPRTTSGKVQRQALARAYEGGRLPAWGDRGVAAQGQALDGRPLEAPGRTNLREASNGDSCELKTAAGHDRDIAGSA